MKKRKVLAWILAASIMITNGSIAFAAENTTNTESSEQTTDISEQNIEIEQQEMDVYGASAKTVYNDYSIYEGEYAEDDFTYVIAAGERTTLSYTPSDGDAVITGYTGPGGDVVIPDFLDGHPVRVLAMGLFLNNKTVTSVQIPSTLENMRWPENVFYGASSLHDIYVEDGNKVYYDIDGVLFRYGASSGLPMLSKYPEAKEKASYTVPDNTNFIDSYAFNECKYLEKIVIPPSVSYITLAGFSNLTDTTIILQQTDPAQIDLVDRAFASLTNCTIIVKNEAMKDAVETEADGATPMFNRTNTTVKIAGNSDLDDSYRTPATSLVLTDTRTASKSITLAPKESQAVSYIISPADTTDSVTWESSNPEVAAVTVKNGKVTVTGVANGECTITGKDESGHALTLNINVWQKVTETQLGYASADSTGTVQIDLAEQYEWERFYDYYGWIELWVYPYNAKYRENVTWTSNSPDVISITACDADEIRAAQEVQTNAYYYNKAKLTLKKPGTATITATLTDGPNVITRSVAIKVTNSGGTVTEPPKQDTNPEETVTESPKQDTPRPEKKSQKITNVSSSYKKAYKNSFTLKPKAKTSCSYKTSNSKVATVSSKGKVTIKGTGKATITITAKATTNYKSATKKVTIYAIPAMLKTPAVTAGRKSLTVKWSKDSKADGYQIQYSTSSKFKKATTVTFSKKTVKKTIKKLKKGKKYYVRIRAYKKIGNKKYYGTWSKVKNVKVK